MSMEEKKNNKVTDILNIAMRCLYAVVIFGLANFYTLSCINDFVQKIWLWIALFVIINFKPLFFCKKIRTKKLKNSIYGCELLDIFLISTVGSVIYNILGWLGIFGLGTFFEETKMWIIGALLCILVEALVFWNGIIRIYITSGQLGVKWRTIGIICGMIPVLNILVLGKMIRLVKKEVKFENDKIILNEQRCDKKLCATKYPILMVHGVFFRDFRYFNYWGRIPDELEKNGAVIYYGNHQSAASVVECGCELAERIKKLIDETGCEKVNVIAHSKGGLDMRYALASCGISDMVASLTTINTPHRGCEFADYLLSKIPEKQQSIVADTYNSMLKKLGDEKPDFIAAVKDLTATACNNRNKVLKDVEGVYYQSVGSKLNHASGGRFPLNFTHHLVKHFDGYNDGLVGEGSFEWGENYQFIETNGKRGISHGDMIDLNRENFDGFDVREFYVELVHKLKENGL